MARHSRIEAERTRQRVLDAAITVFARQGVSASTLQDIADEAGVTRGAIYGHFRDKDDLLQTILDQHALPLERRLAPELGLETGWRRLGQALEELLADGKARRLCEILLHKSERVDSNGPTQARLRQLKTRFQRQLMDLLGRNAKTGELPARLDVAAASGMLCACVGGLVFEGLQNPPGRAPVATLLDGLLQVLRHPPASLLTDSAGLLDLRHTGT
jgi:AcrR family transcriptional regulator